MLRLLRTWRDANGKPAQLEIARRAGLSTSYVSEIFSGKKTPSPDTAADIVQAIKPDRALQLEARGLAEEAANERSVTAGPLGVPIAEALGRDATSYEVHPSITTKQVPSTDLTPYLGRPHDDQLAEIVASAADGRSRIAVLVGGSSSGKTRACWEALRHLGSPWRVWHPLTATELLEGLRLVAGRPTPITHTVIWLNELQRYLLDPDRPTRTRTAAALRKVLSEPTAAPILILGSVWEERWGTLQTADHDQSRELLREAFIRVPEDIGASRPAAQRMARHDERWQLALEQQPDRPIQFLAGAAYLLERYEQATPAGRAVLDAVADARRIGAPSRLRLSFIEKAAHDYLSDVEWRNLPRDGRATWVRDIIHHTERGLALGMRGVDGPLREPRTADGQVGADDPLYELADYLEQYLRDNRSTIQPKDSVWAAAKMTTDPDRLGVMALRARVRGRFRVARALYEAAARAGDSKAWLEVARLFERAGDRKRAEQAYQRERAGDTASTVQPNEVAAAHNDWLALEDLGRGYELQGDKAAARDSYRKAAEAGSNTAWFRIIDLYLADGDPVGAEQLATEVACQGHATPWFALGRHHRDNGDLSAASEAFKAAAEVQILHRRRHSVVPASYMWMQLMRQEADEIESVRDLIGSEPTHPEVLPFVVHAWLRHSAGDRAGTLAAWTIVYRVVIRHGILDDFERMIPDRSIDSEAFQSTYEHLLETDNWRGLSVLGTLRYQIGDLAGSENVLHAAANRGHSDAMLRLAWLRVEAGDIPDAQRLCQEVYDKALRAKDANSLKNAARVWASMGDDRNAERACRQAFVREKSIHGIRGVSSWLGKEITERIAREIYVAALKDPKANNLGDLGDICAELGDDAGARIVDYAVKRGFYRALEDMGLHKEHDGDLVGAEAAYRDAAQFGAVDALLLAARMYLHSGNPNRAAAIYEEAYNKAVALEHMPTLIGLANSTENWTPGASSSARARQYLYGKLLLQNDGNALFELAEKFHMASDAVAAERCYRASIEAGGQAWLPARALVGISILREEADETEDARLLLLQATACGDAEPLYGPATGILLYPGTIARLAQLYINANDKCGARNLMKFGITAAGDPETSLKDFPGPANTQPE